MRTKVYRKPRVKGPEGVIKVSRMTAAEAREMKVSAERLLARQHRYGMKGA